MHRTQCFSSPLDELGPLCYPNWRSWCIFWFPHALTDCLPQAPGEKMHSQNRNFSKPSAGTDLLQTKITLAIYGTWIYFSVELKGSFYRKEKKRQSQRKSKLLRDICVQIDLFEWQQKVIVRFKHFIWLYHSVVTTCWITAPHHDEVFCCSAVSLWSVSKVRPVNRAQLTSNVNVERFCVCTCLHTVVGMLLLWHLMAW